jgi:predicted Zn-dependent protease with MMP-like domain
MRMTEHAFEALVAEALDGLPGEVQRWLDNVDVVVEDWPSSADLGSVGSRPGTVLLGLYHGVPLTARTADYGLVLPDKITLFRRPILDLCATESEVRRQVQRTVLHELAHHFGIDDERLHELGAY